MANRRPKQKSEYGRQLDEKQELKATYALRERQFRKFFRAGSDPELIYRMLELRVDNVVYRAGFASTIRAARQIVSHGHILINGKKTDIPSVAIKLNDVISFHSSSVKKIPFQDLVVQLKKYEPPPWITLNMEDLSAKITALPVSADSMTINRIKPVIGFYSR